MAGNALRQRYEDEYQAPKRQKAPRNKPGVIAVGTMDYTIYLVVVILTLIGVVMVFSSSYLTAGTWKAYKYDPFYFLKRNGMLAIIGFLVMNFMANVNYRYLQKFAPLMYLIGIGLQASVFIFGFSSHGATRWIPVPIIGRFQPSEVVKAALILMLANVVARNNDILRTWKGFFFCLGLVGIMSGLVFYSGFSSALIVAVIGAGMIFIASPYIMRFVIMAAAGGGGVFGLLWYLSTHGDNFRGERFAAWLDPFADSGDTGYQIVQSLFAIASGGMFGLGIGQSRQKSFLPEAHNDIIFSIICEELGFIGAAIVLLLFGILIWRGIRVALNATDTFSAMTAAGIVLMIASQVVINVGVVTNSIPNTGVTMPFISYGGTSLVVCMGLMGILLNISRCSKET